MPLPLLREQVNRLVIFVPTRVALVIDGSIISNLNLEGVTTRACLWGRYDHV